jgi:DNA-binding Lrp family transcriptional regulator
LVKSSNRSKKISFVHELLKDSCRSDRELSKVLGVSQPTVSKMKKSLLEEGVIQGFTMIPKFSKIGYTLLAITFVKIKNILSPADEFKEDTLTAKKWLSQQSNVIFADFCRGMDMDAVMLSIHRTYQDFDEFIKDHNKKLGHQVTSIKSTLVNLAGEHTLKPFHFKYLADDLK